MKRRRRQIAKNLTLQERRRVSGASDQGSALVLVLVLLTVLALALGAMFAQAGANLTTSTVVTGQDNKVYAADGGVEIAIQQLRADPTPCTFVPQRTMIDRMTVTITLRWGINCPGSLVAITAVAQRPDGGKTMTSSAVVSIGLDTSKTVSIVSWVTAVQ